MPLDLSQQEELVARGVAREYIAIAGDRILYRGRREVEQSWRDPEEAVRAALFCWLILEREYPAHRLDIEVVVPRRTPSDFADIVVYRDDVCRVPYLVVEAKKRDSSDPEFDQGIEQAFGNANSLRAELALCDSGARSMLFDVARFPSTERIENVLGPRDALPRDYDRPRTLRLIAGSVTQDIAPVSSRQLETAVRRAHGLIWAGGARDPLVAFHEWCKLLFAKVHDERWTPNGEPRRFQVGVGENEVSVGNRLRALYDDARRRDPTIWTDPIQLPDAKIRDVVAAVQDVALIAMDVDALGGAFESFFSTIFRGGLGQYFTRRELVRFVVAVVAPDETDFVLDPAAGSGGPTSENELYGLRGFVPDRTLLTTLLGQFEAFERDPDSFVGAESPACMALLASEMFGSHVSRRMDPKYHLFKHREAVAAVPSGMRRYTLGEVLVRRREAVVPAETPDETFVTLTLTQEGRLEPREAGKGNNPIDWQGAYFEPGARWFRAETDDLIISRIDVWKGCVAVIPEEYSGAIVTTEFPLYEVRRELLRPVYLKLLLRTGYFQKAMKAITTGHSNRRRTQDRDFEALEIFLPGPDIQDAIVEEVQRRECRIQAAEQEFAGLIARVEQAVMGELTADEAVEDNE